MEDAGEPSAASGTANTWHYEAYLGFVDQPERCRLVVEYFKKYGDILNNVTSFISIGPGNGRVDIGMLQMMPECNVYYGIEPDRRLLDDLAEDMRRSHPGVNAVCVNTKAENWAGPEEAVDFILALHSIYYIEDKTEFLGRCLTWMKPGGTFMAAHVTDDPNYLALASTMGNTAPLGPDISPALNILNFQNVRQDIFDEPLDWKKNPKALLDYILWKPASKQQIRFASKVLEEFWPSGIFVQRMNVYIAEK